MFEPGLLELYFEPWIRKLYVRDLFGELHVRTNSLHTVNNFYNRI